MTESKKISLKEHSTPRISNYIYYLLNFLKEVQSEIVSDSAHVKVWWWWEGFSISVHLGNSLVCLLQDRMLRIVKILSNISLQSALIK